MNTVLWILQVILSIKLISVAFTHGVRHDQAHMQQAIRKTGHMARPLLMVIAMLMLAGAISLLLPAAFRVPTWITPLAAALLAGLMLCSSVFHINCREKPAIITGIIADLVLFAIAAFVAYGRWIILPL